MGFYTLNILPNGLRIDATSLPPLVSLVASPVTLVLIHFCFLQPVLTSAKSDNEALYERGHRRASLPEIHQVSRLKLVPASPDKFASRRQIEVRSTLRSNLNLA